MKLKVYFFNNGVTMAFDGQKQVAEFQKPWFKMYIDFLKENGIKPEECEFTMPNQIRATYLPEYDNWSMGGGNI